jgi:hypothetical protein
MNPGDLLLHLNPLLLLASLAAGALHLRDGDAEKRLHRARVRVCR